MRPASKLVLFVGLMFFSGLVTGDSRRLVYDQGGRMIGVVTSDGAALLYEFDELGNRIGLSVAEARDNSISAIIPKEAVAGAVTGVTIAGRDLASATAVTFADPGINATITVVIIRFRSMVSRTWTSRLVTSLGV